jgi:FkbM family methyltransferase
MIKDCLLTFFLKLPYFKGKTRLESILLYSFRYPRKSKVYGDLLMELDYAEWMQLQLIRGHWLEPQTLSCYEKLLRPGDVFIDVGAHVGFHALVGRKIVGANGFVIAVEPQPYNSFKILRNFRVNGFINLKLFVAAVSDVSGMVELCDQDITDRSVLTMLDSGGKNEAQKFTVPLLRLDSILKDQGERRIKLLKLDVEGLELEAVKGLGDRIKNVDNLLFELLEVNPSPRTLELFLLLAAEGFEIRTLDGVPWTHGSPIPESNLLASRRG